MSARIILAKTKSELKELGKLITPKLKSRMTTADVSELRDRYQVRDGEIKDGPAQTAKDPAPEQAPDPVAV
jgi:hypothetical protein